jgi:hypothetical protein
MSTATTALTSRLRKLSREQLLQLPPEELARIDGFLQETEHSKIDSLLAQTVATFEAGPLLWLSKYSATENPKHEKQGLPFVAPFPKKSYFVTLFDAFLAEDRMLVPKTREMLTSWCMVGYATWRATWFKWDCLIQTESLDKVKELVDYAAQLWRHQPDWLRARHPLKSGDPLTYELHFAAGGRVKAIPGGEDKVRLYHPTLMCFDECAMLPEMEQCWNAAQPVAQQMIGISTARASWFGDECTIPG